MPIVSLNLKNRTYRFSCGESEVQRLQDVAKYLKSKLEALTIEHGAIGDERLILMAALTLADELFDARADVDELLKGPTGDGRSLTSRLEGVEAAGDDGKPAVRIAKGG